MTSLNLVPFMSSNQSYMDDVAIRPPAQEGPSPKSVTALLLCIDSEETLAGVVLEQEAHSV